MGNSLDFRMWFPLGISFLYIWPSKVMANFSWLRLLSIPAPKNLFGCRWFPEPSGLCGSYLALPGLRLGTCGTGPQPGQEQAASARSRCGKCNKSVQKTWKTSGPENLVYNFSCHQGSIYMYNTEHLRLKMFHGANVVVIVGSDVDGTPLERHCRMWWLPKFNSCGKAMAIYGIPFSRSTTWCRTPQIGIANVNPTDGKLANWRRGA